ncbi:hypothetical protein JRO89_XS01G0373200 [Xanthoceras sorbifolium]|uniref:Uncharacterized protein n=1 Tax=Xanthoceras sorbifolium TaxID=99658 RepID=A0ABQ8IQ49_9ROSI|nr:hypothetical protein JRO89_XS01G0373200 [Xanthoceras sorbifolium]
MISTSTITYNLHIRYRPQDNRKHKMEIPVAFPPTKRIAVVTGANKGIGLEICRQLASNGVVVILTARDNKRGHEAIKTLHDSGFSDVFFHQLDLMDPSSVGSLANFIKTQFNRLDILVNNAGVSGMITDAEAFTSLNLKSNELLGVKAEMVKQVVKRTYETDEGCIRTNYYGTKQVTEALIPLLLQSHSARIVNVSSTLGQLKFLSNERAKEVLSNVDDLTEEKIDHVVKGFLDDAKEGLQDTKGWPVNLAAYVVSKAALDAYPRILAKKLTKICTNAVSPGFVKTDLSFNNGQFTVEEGARGPVMLALAPDGGASGLFFDQMELSTF